MKNSSPSWVYFYFSRGREIEWPFKNYDSSKLSETVPLKFASIIGHLESRDKISGRYHNSSQIVEYPEKVFSQIQDESIFISLNQPPTPYKIDKITNGKLLGEPGHRFGRNFKHSALIKLNNQDNILEISVKKNLGVFVFNVDSENGISLQSSIIDKAENFRRHKIPALRNQVILVGPLHIFKKLSLIDLMGIVRYAEPSGFNDIFKYIAMLMIKHMTALESFDLGQFLLATILI